MGTNPSRRFISLMLILVFFCTILFLPANTQAEGSGDLAPLFANFTVGPEPVPAGGFLQLAFDWLGAPANDISFTMRHIESDQRFHMTLYNPSGSVNQTHPMSPYGS